MKKQFKNILQNSPISIKWKNFNSWQKQEGITNLLEACEYYNINIRAKKGDVLVLKLDKNFRIIYQSSVAWFERDIVNLIAMFNQYLGDTAKIETRFRSIKIN